MQGAAFASDESYTEAELKCRPGEILKDSDMIFSIHAPSESYPKRKNPDIDPEAPGQ